ncbi:tripartite tricarboxylate transporter substrate binding protein [Cupriavidus lacunae]|uniref:Tripartite tricarboxylate transporter substrate binding protein n=1 Tax=Cupriavidus lacunae TaxID=2666307 RepID=A0A370NLW0_9BURK|nr:tripartite tricarboxylate transporter substrate binding protein [Cupriavidus lacunae]RDK06607.1 tripartite tricarboxylate transporter substrate binding protein [Cupriavidus lacunae]
MKCLKALLASGVLATLGLAGAAQAAYPDKPIRLIVGFPAGGASDVAARAIAAKMGAMLGQAIVIENKAGAASNIGSDYVAKATPEGYTLLFGTISLAVNPSLYRKLSYDPLKDLAPIAQVASTPFLVVVNPGTPYHSLADLIAAAKRPADKPIYFASAGNGSGAHLFAELFNSQAGVKMRHVPYRGAAPAMSDVLGGQVPLTFDNIVTTLPLVKGGKLRPLAVTSKTRSRAAPDIPTVAEAGVPGYDATAWFGLFAPAGTPADVIQKLSATAAQATQAPEVRAALEAVGCDPMGTSPHDFDAFFKSEVRKWAKVVDEAHVHLD